MRVLWIHNYDPANPNAGTYMHLFAEGMRAAGIDLELLYLPRLSDPRALMSARGRVAAMCGEFDIVHAQTGSAVGLVGCAARSAVRVLSLRGSEWYRYRERWNREALHAAMAVSMTRLSLGAYHHVVVMSSKMARELEAARPGTAVTAIPDPIDIDRFVPLDRDRARAALGAVGDRSRWVLFTTLSRTNPIKRVELAEAAVAEANRLLGGVQLKVASGIPHLQMPGFVAACDVALSTSVHEGWPNAVKEALACGLPFVATDVSDLGDIAAAEPSCRVCSPDASELGRALADVLVGKAGPVRRFVEPMATRLVVAEMLRVYESTLSSRQKTPAR